MSSFCPACGYQNRGDARYCAECSSRLTTTLRCPACGAANPSEYRFCSSCGGSTSLGAFGSAADVVGRTFAGDRFRIERLLGEGSRKRVYLAVDTQLERDVAIAVIRPDAVEPSDLAELDRQAQATRALGEHPNIVAILDAGFEGGVPYVVSEYMPAPSLADSAQDGFTLAKILAIGQDICAGLAHAHAGGVIHRALKPKRIWIAAEGMAKIGDFGVALSRRAPKFTTEGWMAGAVHYMAPEQALGEDLAPTADLYALGAILYELLCGRVPFVGDHVLDVVAQHLHAAPPPLAMYGNLPEGLEELVLSLLAKSSDERPQSAGTVGSRLAAIASGAEVDLPTATERPQDDPLDRLDELFVGREAETDVLRRALNESLAGRGRLVLISGDAGIGKTRLAAELAKDALEAGAETFWARCYEGAGAPAYWPWVQILRSYVRARGTPQLSEDMGAGAVEMAQIAGEIRERLPGLPTASAGDPEGARIRLFEAVGGFLTATTQRNPGVLIIDDLHWADSASLSLLESVIDNAAGRARLLVIAPYRESDVSEGHPLFSLLERLRDHELADHLVLDGLPNKALTGLLEQAATEQLDATGRALATVLGDESEGNPFFFHELVRHLLESEAISLREGRWVMDVTSIGDLGIPDGVRDVVSARLARLPPECNAILTVAAVIGREFSCEILEEIIDVEPAVVQAALLDAEKAFVLAAMNPEKTVFTFSHALIRETLYERLTTARQVRLHRRIAEALRRLYGDGASDVTDLVSALAYHYYEAARDGDIEEAMRYAELAARRATENFAYEAAATHWRHAINALKLEEPVDERRLSQLLLELGHAEWGAGDFEQSREVFEEAAQLSATVGNREVLAQAALGFGGHMGFRAGVRDQRLIALLEDALASLDGESVLRARLMARLAEALTFSDVRDRVERLGRNALETAQSLGDPATRASVMTNAHWALWGPDTLRERLSMAREIVRCAEQVGDSMLAMDGRLWAVADLLELGDVPAADREAAVWSDLAEETKQLYHRWLVGVYKAMRALMEGRLNDAETLAQEAFLLGQRGNNENAVQLFGVQMAGIRRDQDRYLELEEGLKTFVAQYPAISTWRCALSLMYSESDMEEPARAEFETIASQGFENLPRDLFWMTSIVQLSQTCAYLGDAARAQDLYALLSPYGKRNVQVGTVASAWGSTSRTLGLLAVVLQRWDEAITHFEDGLKMNSDMGVASWHAQTQQEYASMLIARSGPGDSKRAAELLGSALDTAHKLGLTRQARRIAGVELPGTAAGQTTARG